MANGWITKRCHQTGHSIGGRSGPHKGPLRDVKEVIRFGEGMFDRDSVIFVCGHKGSRSVGAQKGRCRECGKDDPKYARTAREEQGKWQH